MDAILAGLGPTFNVMYSAVGRPSIPPEHLFKASVLMALYSIRSERQFCERLRYDMLFRWFLDIGIDDACFVPTAFSKNRERLLGQEVADKFFVAVTEAGRGAAVRGPFHCGWHVAGSLGLAQELPARHRRPDPAAGGRNPEVDFRGQADERDPCVDHRP